MNYNDSASSHKDSVKLWTSTIVRASQLLAYNLYNENHLIDI